MEGKEKIIVALDVPNLDKAKRLTEELADHVGMFKVGLQLITAEGGPRVVKAISELGGKVMYDGKFHDIPNTVLGASNALPDGVKMFTVHCLGGGEMLRKACQSAKEKAIEQGTSRPLVLGVTVLTSLDYESLADEMRLLPTLNYADPEELKQAQTEGIQQLVINLVLLAQDAGLDGAVCSPQEIRILRRWCQPEFLVVTSGIRPTWAAKGDQKRITTPAEAIKMGADYLVIGRPITQPPKKIGSPVEAAKRIAEEIAKAMEEIK